MRGMSIVLAFALVVLPFAGAEPVSEGADHMYGTLVQGEVDENFDRQEYACAAEYRGRIVLVVEVDGLAPEDVVRVDVDMDKSGRNVQTVRLTAEESGARFDGEGTDGCMPWVRLTGERVASQVRYRVDEYETAKGERPGGSHPLPVCVPAPVAVPCPLVPAAPALPGPSR